MLQVAAAKSHGHCSFLLNFHAEDATYIYAAHLRQVSGRVWWHSYSKRLARYDAPKDPWIDLKKKKLLTAGMDTGTERYNATKLSKLQGSQITSLPLKCKGVLWPIPTSTGGALAMRRSKCRKSHCTQDGGSTMLGNKGLKSDRCLLFCSPAWGCLADSAIVSGILRDWSLHRVSAWIACVTACFVPQDETRAERLLRFACNCDSLTAANIQCNVTYFGLQLLAVIFQLFQLFLCFQCENTKRLRKGGPRRLLNRRQMLKISIANKTGLQTAKQPIWGSRSGRYNSG